MAAERRKVPQNPADVVFDIGESSKSFLSECQSQLSQVSSVTNFDADYEVGDRRSSTKSESGSPEINGAGGRAVRRSVSAGSPPKGRTKSNLSVRFDVGAPDTEEEMVEQSPLISHAMSHENRGPPEPHKMYIELYDLNFGTGGEAEWQETARWIKYEEDAEGMDHHWGRPHVAFLSFHALLQLRKCVAKGVVSLDLEAGSYDEICEHIAVEMAAKFEMDEERMGAIISSLHKKHKHVHEGHHMPHIPTLPRIQSQHSTERKMSAIAEASQEVSRAPSILGGSIFKINGEQKSSKFQTGLSIDEEDDPQQKARADTGAITIPNSHSQPDAQVVTYQKQRSDTGISAGLPSSRSQPPPLVRQLSGIGMGNFKRQRGDSIRQRSFTKGSRSRLNFMGSKTPSFLNLGRDENDAQEILRIVPDDAETAQVRWWNRKKRSKMSSAAKKKSGADSNGHKMSHPPQVGAYSRTKTAPGSHLEPPGGYSRTTTAPGRLSERIWSHNLLRLDSEVDILMKKVYEDAEAVEVFVGVLKELKGARFAMVRLADAIEMPELLEAPIPIRFVFVILGPNLIDIDYHELGRSISTLMSNPHFHEIAYRAESREELISAIDEFLDESIVVPPGEIDNRQLLAPEQIKKALRKRKRKRTEALERMKSEDKKAEPEKPTSHGQIYPDIPRASISSGEKLYNPLERTGTLFGGVFQDIKRRLPYYVNDYTDALNFQCITSMIFMFFAAFAPAITFGGLMGSYTNDAMGITETLLAQCLCGVIWGLFSAQPLLIMSATGPVLIFEASLYAFCATLGLDFLVVRVWAGVWLAIIAFLTVMFEGSFLVSYVTRFTEDIFAVLISAIFISESIKFLQKTFKRHPVMNITLYMDARVGCQKEHEYKNYLAKLFRLFPNSTAANYSSWINSEDSKLLSDGPFSSSSALINETVNNSLSVFNGSQELATAQEYRPFEGCNMHHQPDTALLTAILLLATFALAYYLKKLRTSYYLGRTLRRAIGDFGVLIAIIVVSLFDILVFSKPFLRRLEMPDSFSFTNATARGGNSTIFISLDLGDKWVQGILFALVPALLVYILLFVETEITQLLLAKKERGLRRGSGFHWDLLLMGLLALLCSFLGLPWMCAAAVQSLAHASSLTVMKRHAPGERPAVDYVIEQRVTTIGVALLVGACAFAGSLLKHLPLCVLFGVFLYLGVMNLVGVQFLSRIVLLFIPEKYFPDVAYCQKVRMWRMHLYTIIQILSLVGVYIVKYFKSSSLAFPFVLMFTAVIRMFVLPRIFSEQEIKALDAHEEEMEDEFDEADLYEEAHGLGM